MIGACEFQKFSMIFYFKNDVIKGSYLSLTIYHSAYLSVHPTQSWMDPLMGFSEK